MFGLSRQAYFKQRHKRKSTIEERASVRKRVLSIRHQMPRIGTRKLHFMLKGEIGMGRDRLFRFLREERLLIVKRRTYIRTTQSSHWLHKYPSLVGDFIPMGPEQLWVADITYIDTTEDGHNYLHLVTDAYSKQVMGYELCTNMEARSTLRALKMAIKNRRYDHDLIHHSDRGVQYCSGIYVQELQKNGIAISMTQSGSPYENAVAERMNGILKQEFGLGDRLRSFSHARALAKQGIDIYNQLRPHSSCEMLTPEKMHEQKNVKIKTYKKV